MSFFVTESEQKKGSKKTISTCFVFSNNLWCEYSFLLKELKYRLTIDLGNNGFDTSSLARDNWQVTDHGDSWTVETQIPLGCYDAQMMINILATSMQQLSERIVCGSISGDETNITVVLSKDENDKRKITRECNNEMKSGCDDADNSKTRAKNVCGENGSNGKWRGTRYMNQNLVNISNCVSVMDGNFIEIMFRNMSDLNIHNCYDIACFSSHGYKRKRNLMKRFGIVDIRNYINNELKYIMKRYYYSLAFGYKHIVQSGKTFAVARFNELIGFFIGIKDKKMVNDLKLNLKNDVENIKVKINTLVILKQNGSCCWPPDSIELVCLTYHVILILLYSYQSLILNVNNVLHPKH